jgi:hypothetical protein
VQGVRPSCDEKFYYDETKCECVCKEIKKCRDEEVFDKFTCECIKKHEI